MIHTDITKEKKTMISAVIKTDSRKDEDGNNRYTTRYTFSPSEHDDIYSCLETLLAQTYGEDRQMLHIACADAASWCELASVGETYEFATGEIEIIEEE